MPSSRNKIATLKRRLVVALDVGTTYSGASYSIIEPGGTPEVYGVHGYPPATKGGDAKIPTILLYDRQGKVAAVGEEACQLIQEEQASEDMQVSDSDFSVNDYQKVQWWKLHIRPDKQELPSQVSPLPKGKKIFRILADFLQYLYNCVLDWISEKHFYGRQTIGSYKKSEIHFVITYPNGWEGTQQTMIRKAAITAGLVDDMNDALERISLVTEGEAALRYCLLHKESLNWQTAGASEEGVMIVDAGGGTIDFSGYIKDQDHPDSLYKLREIVTPRSLFQGSVFVTKAAKDYLAARLKGSRYADEVDQIADSFDKTVKVSFDQTVRTYPVKFGSTLDSDAAYGIKSGQIKIPGDTIAGFFKPPVDAIVDTIKALCTEARTISNVEIKKVFLVGGFATSKWLRKQVQEGTDGIGIELHNPDRFLNKAVADGAVGYFLNHYVTSRISKYTYGTLCHERFSPHDPEHLARVASVFTNADGEQYVRGVFEPILVKGKQAKDVTEFRKTFFRNADTLQEFDNPMKDIIICYKGSNQDCKWMDNEPDSSYPILCTIESNVTQALKYLPLSEGRNGKYYHLSYDIILSFGLAELKAEVEIRYKARRSQETIKRFTAQIIYEGTEDENIDEL